MAEMKDLVEKLKALVADAESQMAADVPPVPTPDVPPVDPAQMKDLADKVKALGDERDAKAKEVEELRAAIQAHIDDEKTDTERLEQALKPIEEVKVEAPVPDVPVGPESPVQGNVEPSQAPEQAPEGQHQSADQGLSDIAKG